MINFKRLFLIITCVLAVYLEVFSFNLRNSYAMSEGTLKIQEATEVIEEILRIPEKGIPPALLRNAEGIAIIPGVVKIGFVLGGRHGKGIIMIRNENGQWTNPAFVSITGGSLGWQIGAKSTDIILVFKTKKSVTNIMKGKFTLGADAAVAAGPVGRTAGAATDAQLKAEIYSYSRSRGLFAGVSLDGSAISIDYDSNIEYYGERGGSVKWIFSGSSPKRPEIIKLHELLEKHARP